MANISVFLPSLEGGGAERMVLNISGELARRGHDVDIVVARAEGEFVDDVRAGVNLVSLEAPSLPGYSLLGSLPGLTRYLRSRDPEAFLSVLNRANVVAILAHQLSLTDGRLVVSERNNLSKFIRKTNRRNRVLPYLIRLSYPRVDAIIAISEGLADDLTAVAGLPREYIDVVYNPAYTPDIEQKATEPVDHPWLNGEHEVILGVGSLTRQKDFPTLIRAFAKVRDERDGGTKLIILGKGEKRSVLKGIASELGVDSHVDMPGFVNNPYAYMARSNIFVLSSEWEGFGNVIVEALACGTPVVSTDCPSGPREILQDSEYGRLVPVNDPVSLAEAIVPGLDESVDSERLKRRAREFSVERITDQYERLLLPETE